MTQISRLAAGAAGLALLTLPLLAPAAGADTNTTKTKAQIERDERSGHPTKAQVEARERTGTSMSHDVPGDVPATPRESSNGDAAGWQLALSAALGAAVTGGVVLTSRQVSHHRHAVAH